MAQRSYDPLDTGIFDDDPEFAHRVARRARDADLRTLRACVPVLTRTRSQVRGFALKGQLRKYSGLDRPDGRVRTVYYIDAPALSHDELDFLVREYCGPNEICPRCRVGQDR